MKREQQDREDQRLAEHGPNQCAPLQALAHLERLANQDDLAEDQGVHDGEALMPDAYPMPLDQLLMQAEQREQKPEIDSDDRVFLEFAERAFRQTLLSAGRCGRRVCDVLHGPPSVARLRSGQDQKPRRSLAHYYNLAKRRKEHLYNGDDTTRPFPSEYVPLLALSGHRNRGEQCLLSGV